MHELLKVLANMRDHAKKLKEIIRLSPGDTTPLREALRTIETAIYVMERAAADSYGAA